LLLEVALEVTTEQVEVALEVTEATAQGSRLGAGQGQKGSLSRLFLPNILLPLVAVVLQVGARRQMATSLFLHKPCPLVEVQAEIALA
jgi:hypothetical protein